MIAFSVDRSRQLHLAWQRTQGPNPGLVSSPAIAGGIVYSGDGLGSQILAFDAATGQRLWSSESNISGGIFATPMVVNGHLYVAGWNGHLYAFGL
jgi:outer membrane protein assembly factor BamB